MILLYTRHPIKGLQVLLTKKVPDVHTQLLLCSSKPEIHEEQCVEDEHISQFERYVEHYLQIEFYSKKPIIHLHISITPDIYK